MWEMPGVFLFNTLSNLSVLFALPFKRTESSPRSGKPGLLRVFDLHTLFFVINLVSFGFCVWLLVVAVVHRL